MTNNPIELENFGIDIAHKLGEINGTFQGAIKVLSRDTGKTLGPIKDAKRIYKNKAGDNPDLSIKKEDVVGSVLGLAGLIGVKAIFDKEKD